MTAPAVAPEYDALIVGGGAGGMESALALGEMGFQVLLVEKEASVGGRMILLSKVFPTLDCASCISTPKMAAVNNHPNVRTLVYSEVDAVERRPDGRFRVRLTRKPTYIDPAKCTGCALCEAACTVTVPDEFNADLVGRHAAHIAFPQAVPKKAVITRPGRSPCTASCPAGVKPHGYVSLVRAGLYDEAFSQHLADAPFPGVLGRACYAPCEEACTRGELEGAVSIRAIKRFMADRYYSRHPEPEYGPPPERSAYRVAVVGSGPAGLSAAYFLARAGHSVELFEAESEPGGIMRWGIPSYRLPKEVLARDIRNVTALGVEIHTNQPIASVSELTQAGFGAVFLATGDKGGRRLAVPGEELSGVLDSMRFLHDLNSGAPPSFRDKKVVVVGGGNVAIDSARSALRLGAESVDLFCLEARAEMPAHPWEIREAEEEGVHVHPSWGVRRLLGYDGHVNSVEFVRCTSVFDAERRFHPAFNENVVSSQAAEVVVTAIGLSANTGPFGQELRLNRNGTFLTDPETLQTTIPGVFAGGDAATGPSMIVSAIGQGKRAAFYIDRFLRGESLTGATFDPQPPAVDREEVASRAKGALGSRTPGALARTPVPERLVGFESYEATLSEPEAREAASRCLDCGVCSECRQCVAVCPASAIDLAMASRTEEVTVGAIALATGFIPFDARRKPALGAGRFPNVITGVQMDRILAPTRPYNAVLRPSDGKAPSNVAFVLCTGSRDEKLGHRLCSRVCCMYSMKQAQLLMGALPLADVTIYYIDIRAFGKGYEEFYQQTRGMSVNFTKGKVARIEETDQDDLIVHYEDIEHGGAKSARHDLVVLAVGLQPNPSALRLFPAGELAADRFDYIREVDEELEPGRTNLPGVYAVGAATAVRDIPDTILHAEAAAAQVAAYLTQGRRGR